MREIVTERLLLRPLRLDDAETLHRLLDLDPAVWRLDPGFSRSLAERRAELDRRLAHYATFGFGCLAAVETATGDLIGQGGLNPWFAEGPDGSLTLEFEVMYGLGSAYWNRGLGTELAEASVRHAFEHIRLARLLVGPARENHRSIRVLEKLGFDVADDPLEPACKLASLQRGDWLERNRFARPGRPGGTAPERR